MDDRFHPLGYRVTLTEDEGVWVATARRLDTGDAFGPPVPREGAEEAAEALARWLEWQHAHATALSALQTAASAYHRLASERFAAADDDSHREAVREALVRVDALRRDLDRVREQKPWPY